MTDARDLVHAIMHRLSPPAWVRVDITGMTPAERQAAATRVAYWLTRVLAGDHEEYGH